MVTVGDIINEISKIRRAADDIEVKGKQNAALLCYVCDKCDELVDTLNKTIEEIQNGSKNEPQENTTLTEVGEENGEPDRDPAG